MIKVENIFNNKSHPIWVFIQQFAVRGLLGVKFLLIARLLNPRDVGIISIALISLTISESLTEMGIMQAIVQNKNRIAHYRAVWTLQFLRGFFITIVLLLLNNFLVNFFGEPEAKKVLFLVAFVPLIRNSISAKYYYEIRDKNFRDISIIFGVASLIDLVVSIVLVAIFRDPLFAIISLLVAELAKVILTHIIFGWTINFDFHFNKIKDVIVYGRWIWGNSISSLFINQFDKIIASAFLGTKMLGLYQMSQKMTQLAVADISFAAGQYLFPQFSHIYRKSNNSNYLKKFYCDTMLLMILFSCILSSFVIIYNQELISIILGDKWKKMGDIIKLMMVSSSLAAITNVSVIYNRAIGKPKKVTVISYIQLIFFVLSCLILVHFFSVFGLIMSNLISYLISLLLLNFMFNNKFLYISNSIKRNFFAGIVIISIILLMLFLKKLVPINLSFVLSFILLLFGIFYIGYNFKKWGNVQ